MFNKYFMASEDNIDFLYANAAITNINFAMVSLNHILYRKKFEIGLYHDEHTYYFFHIQSVLTACGNISNVFYNKSNNQSVFRSKRLRDTFKVTRGKYPLIFQKEVRNTNEHFDERYEDFSGVLGDYNLLDCDTDVDMREDIQNKVHLRTYDKESGIYHTFIRKDNRLQKFQYNLHELETELGKMLVAINSHPTSDSAWVKDHPTEVVK